MGEYFVVTGSVIGWLGTEDDDIAIVIDDSGSTFLRWLGNDYSAIEAKDGMLEVGHRIHFMTTLAEQIAYGEMAMKANKRNGVSDDENCQT